MIWKTLKKTWKKEDVLKLSQTKLGQNKSEYQSRGYHSNYSAIEPHRTQYLSPFHRMDGIAFHGYVKRKSSQVEVYATRNNMRNG